MPNKQKKVSKSTKVVLVRAPTTQKRAVRQPLKTKPTVLGGLMRAGGSALGGFVGGPLGASLGKMAGSALSRITGQGAYAVSGNAADKTLSFGANMADELILTRTELIGSVSSSEVFSIQSYDLNPGLAATLPWGSGICKLYEQYQMYGAVLSYKSTSGNVSTDPALGAVYIATEYDPDRPVYTSKQEMMTALFSQETVPSRSIIHAIECASTADIFGNHRYVRTLPSASSKRLTDIGRISIATQGQSSTGAQLGEIWLTYKVRLIKPLFSLAAAPEALIPQFLRSDPLDPTITRSNYFGVNPLSDGPVHVVKPSGANNSLVFVNPGVYNVAIRVRITSLVTNTTNLSVGGFSGSGLTITQPYEGVAPPASMVWFTPGSLATVDSCMSVIRVTSTVANATLTFPDPWPTGTAFGANLQVLRLGNAPAPATVVVLSQSQLDRQFQAMMLSDYKERMQRRLADQEDYDEVASVRSLSQRR